MGTARFLMPDGYVRVSVPGGTAPEHRLIAERALGRPLLPTEQVHHRNGVKDDNRPENLEVLTPKEHSAIHLGLNGRWALEHDRCSECQSTDRPHLATGLCGRCYRRLSMRCRRRRARLDELLELERAALLDPPPTDDAERREREGGA